MKSIQLYGLTTSPNSFIEEDYFYDIKYLKDTYDAKISDVDSFLALL